MQHCKFYDMVNTYRGKRKSPVLAVFTFDGTRIGKDFSRPLQQHSWRFANSLSLSKKQVWLTHACLVPETKTNMTPIFRYVHNQLKRPQARIISVNGVERPVDFVCVCDAKANLQVLSQQSSSAHYCCTMCTMR